MLTVRLELYQGKKSLDHSCARVRLVLRKSGGSLYISRIPVVVGKATAAHCEKTGENCVAHRPVAAQHWQISGSTVPVAVHSASGTPCPLLTRWSPTPGRFRQQMSQFCPRFHFIFDFDILGGVLWNTLGALQGGRTSLPPQAWHLTARIRQHSAEISCALLTITQSYIYNMENLYFFFLEE